MIKPRLHPVQACIDPIGKHQLFMAPLFSNNPIIQHNNPTGHAHGRKAVADNQGSFPPRQLIKLPDQLILGFNIQRAGGLIKNHD